MKRHLPLLASENVSAADDICSDFVGGRSIESRCDLIEEGALGGQSQESGGSEFYENWDEIDPPGHSDDEPEIPHEEVVGYVRDLLKKRRVER